MRGTYSQRFADALLFAYTLHAGQTRKGSDTPYVSHLMAVCGLAMEHGGGEDEAIAALLHDAVEDQGGKAVGDDIERRFGPAVRAIVDGCTDTDQDPKPPWRARKEAYVAHVATASDSIRLVSACDKLHNARTMLTDLRLHGPQVWTRFKVGPDQHVWYFRSLIAAFRQAGGPKGPTDELERVIDDLERALG